MPFILAALFYLVDIAQHKKWTYPFVVCGMNSIALYILIWLIPGWLNGTLQTHLGSGYGSFFGEALAPLIQNLIVGAFLWLICFWMYRSRIFLRI